MYHFSFRQCVCQVDRHIQKGTVLLAIYQH